MGHGFHFNPFDGSPSTVESHQIETWVVGSCALQRGLVHEYQTDGLAFERQT